MVKFYITAIGLYWLITVLRPWPIFKVTWESEVATGAFSVFQCGSAEHLLFFFSSCLYLLSYSYYKKGEIVCMCVQVFCHAYFPWEVCLFSMRSDCIWFVYPCCPTTPQSFLCTHQDNTIISQSNIWAFNRILFVLRMVLTPVWEYQWLFCCTGSKCQIFIIYEWTQLYTVCLTHEKNTKQVCNDECLSSYETVRGKIINPLIFLFLSGS